MAKDTIGVEVLTLDQKFFKRYASVKEAAKELGYSETGMYSKCDGKPHIVRNLPDKYIFRLIPKEENSEDAMRRAGETEDQTRRRLGLNPYGEWRNDEFINEMIKKANKELGLSEDAWKHNEYYEILRKRRKEGEYTTDTHTDTRNWEL